jgi:RHS repeat-associated protein
MLRTLAYEPLRNVVASVENTVGGATVSRFGYTHDQVYRRTHTVFSGSAFAAAAFARYTHNDRAELTAADKFLGTDTADETSPVPAYAYAYDFDPIGQPSEARRPTGTVGATIGSGNSRWTASDAETGTTVSKTYTPDQLNQYTAIVQPGTPPVTVSPQHDATDSRTRAAGETGDRMVAVSPPCGRTATSQTTLDNADGSWTLAWNADSRAKRDGRPERSERPSGASTPRLVGMTGDDSRIQFLYDYRGRRVEKRVYTGTAATGWALSETRRFLYEGWTLVAEFTLDGRAPVLDRTHLWGIDLSGSLEGAGGIGGLLRTRLVSPTGSAYYYPTYDASGNVSEYLDAAGTVAAHYEYAPFGKTVAATGPLADAFAFRFSTKYLDAETGLLYYGYRHLDPETGRWLSRDPLGEQGGANLYAFVVNSPLVLIDPLGLQEAMFGDVNPDQGPPPNDEGDIDEQWMLNVSILVGDNPLDNPNTIVDESKVGAVGGRAPGVPSTPIPPQGMSTGSTWTPSVSRVTRAEADSPKEVAQSTKCPGKPPASRRTTLQQVRDYLADVKAKSLAQLMEDMESVGLKLKGMSPDGKFMEFEDRHGNVRAKIHPPDKNTAYDHLHIYDHSQTPLDVNLRQVGPRDPAAHIEIRREE